MRSPTAPSRSREPAPDTAGKTVAARPLAGRTIVLDPGHQLGNRHFPSQIRRQVPAGGFPKACNTTGTSTNGGYPEATFAWKVSQGSGAACGASVRR